jgi:hypothetical protein
MRYVLKHEKSQPERETQQSLKVSGPKNLALCPVFMVLLSLMRVRFSGRRIGVEKRGYTRMHATTLLILQSNVFGRQAREQVEKKTSVRSEEREE